MNNVSTFGLTVYLRATISLPTGYLLKSWPDDADSLQVHEATSGQAQLDLNGKIVRWTDAQPLTVSLAAIPDSDEDQTLSVVFNASRATAFGGSVGDIITLVIRYPNNSVRTLTNGRMLSGPTAPSATAAGRMPANVYTIAFGDQFSLTPASVLSRAASIFRVRERIGGLLP